MSDKIKSLIQDIEDLKDRLKEEIDLNESHIAYDIRQGRILFDDDRLKKQKQKVVHFFNYLREAPLLHVLSAPIVYAMLLPAIILDVMLFIYQQVIFRIYKFKFIKRSDYIVFDRQYLGYLNIIEKINCMYCSYFNGLINYTAAIAAKSEFYFCPIKHAKKVAYTHRHYYDYMAYGDDENYQEKLEKLQKKAQSK